MMCPTAHLMQCRRKDAPMRTTPDPRGLWVTRSAFLEGREDLRVFPAKEGEPRTSNPMPRRTETADILATY